MNDNYLFNLVLKISFKTMIDTKWYTMFYNNKEHSFLPLIPFIYYFISAHTLQTLFGCFLDGVDEIFKIKWWPKSLFELSIQLTPFTLCTIPCSSVML